MRFAIPVVDRRGSGLGNELILWAKAHIAGQILDMTTFAPAWGINRRKYWRYFRTSRLDYVLHRTLRVGLPSIRFREEDFKRHGGSDYAQALLSFAIEQDIMRRDPFVLEVDGLWGGPGMLGLARDFIFGKLLAARWSTDNLFKIDYQTNDLALRVGVHIRRGDFGSPSDVENYAGRFNVAVPLGWYEAIMSNLHSVFGSRVVFVIASDASPDELSPITSKFPCILTHDIPNNDVSDLLALVNSDFLVCSISSFSLWAAFLGEMPYAWFAPQLSFLRGTRSIWGHLAMQQQPDSPIGQAIKAGIPEVVRGSAIGMDGILPEPLIRRLETTLQLKSRHGDLIRYGVIGCQHV